MSVPNLTDEDRARALRHAAEVRKERAAVLNSLSDGTLGVEDILERKDDPVYGRIMVRSLIMRFPGIGKAKCDAFMEEVGISERRRVLGLGVRQAEEVLALAERRGVRHATK
jgi:hypothetical protein